MISHRPLLFRFNIHRRDLRIFWLLGVLCTLLWLPPIVGLARGYWPLGEDALAFFGPMREFAHQSVQEGILPLWNPYTFCGMPFIANSQVAFWYPPNCLLGFLPTHWALILDIWLHTLIMAVGGYVLARSLGLSRTSSFLVAVILSLSSPITARAYAGHMTWQAARAYFPWMLWATWQGLKGPHRILWIRLTVFSTLCVLAGHPPMMLLGFGLCAVLIGYWCLENIFRNKKAFGDILRSAASPLSALCFAGILSACALLPMRELAGLTVHGSRLSFAESAVLSGTWKTIARLLAPDWFGGNQNLQWSQPCCSHEENAYIGLLPILLALSAPFFLCPPQRHFRVLALWFLLPFSLFMALGANTPLYGIVWHIVPPLQMTRIPVRWLECFYIAGALLTGFSFRAVFEKLLSHTNKTCEYSQRNIRILSSSIVALMLLSIVVTLTVSFSNQRGEFWTNAARTATRDTVLASLHSYGQELYNVALAESLVVVVLCAIMLFLLRCWQRALSAEDSCTQSNKIMQRLKKVTVVFSAFNLLLYGWRSAELVSPQAMRSIRWPAVITSRYQEKQRWNTSFYWQAINGAVPNKIRLLNGYDPLGGKRFFEFASVADGRKRWDAVYQPMRRSALWNVAGVTHTVAQISQSAPNINTHGWHREVSSGKWELWKHDAAWPLFYTTNNIVRVPENQQLQVLNALAQKPVKHNWPLITSAKFDMPSRGTSSVVLQTHNSNEVRFQTQSSQGSALVWSEANFPGWRAWINEKPAMIESANYLFQAVKIPRGQTAVRFVYEPQCLRLGVFISLCGVALMLAMIVAMPYRNQEIKDRS